MTPPELTPLQLAYLTPEQRSLFESVQRDVGVVLAQRARRRSRRETVLALRCVWCVVVLVAVAAVLLAGCGAPSRTLTISGAGEGTRITYNCGPDSGATCTEVITDARGPFRKQVELPIGTVARVTVVGFGSKSCRIADVTDGISYDRQDADWADDEAACGYRVQ